MEYKDTLLMPKTEFPMRGDLPTNEPAMQEKWKKWTFIKKYWNVLKVVRTSFYMMDLHMQMVIFIWVMH